MAAPNSMGVGVWALDANKRLGIKTEGGTSRQQQRDISGAFGARRQALPQSYCSYLVQHYSSVATASSSRRVATTARRLLVEGQQVEDRRTIRK